VDMKIEVVSKPRGSEVLQLWMIQDGKDATIMCKTPDGKELSLMLLSLHLDKLKAYLAGPSLLDPDYFHIGPRGIETC
jgi:hypothetical protein